MLQTCLSIVKCKINQVNQYCLPLILSENEKRAINLESTKKKSEKHW